MFGERVPEGGPVLGPEWSRQEVSIRGAEVVKQEGGPGYEGPAGALQDEGGVVTGAGVGES